MARIPHKSNAVTIYVDGAGGDRMPWTQSVFAGLREAGVNDEIHPFGWYSGRGLMADHTTSVEWKRRRARQLAELLTRARHQSVVNLVAFSAGTAIAAYALELLGPSIRVDTVVFLASSLSSNFKLAPVVGRLHKLYVFASNRDLMLRLAIPVFGTADRRWVAPAAGVNGFSKKLEDVITIPWSPQYRAVGNNGGHTDYVRADFIEAHVAPLLYRQPARVAA